MHSTLRVRRLVPSSPAWMGQPSLGVSAQTTGANGNQITSPIFIPSGWTGTMPNGNPINSNSTLLRIRTQYRKDPEYPVVAAYAAGTRPARVFKFHCFCAETGVATAYAVHFLLFLERLRERRFESANSCSFQQSFTG